MSKQATKERTRSVRLDKETDHDLLIGAKLEGSISKFIRAAISAYYELKAKSK